MLEKNQTISINEIKIILESQKPLLVSSNAENIKIQFGSEQDFSNALIKLKNSDICPKECSMKDLSLTIEQKVFIEFLTKNLSQITKPIANTEKVSTFMKFKIWLQSKKPNLTNNTPPPFPPFLTLPYDLIEVIMKFLNRYEDRLSFALCIVSAYFQYNHLKLPIQLSATKANAKAYYSRFFRVARAVNNTTLLAEGFSFNDREGLFGWGLNSLGQLGLGYPSYQIRPQRITAFKGKKVISVARDRHSLFVTNKGEVFSCGDNRYGQLGLGHKNEVISPQLITALKDHKVISASVGEDYSLFLTQEGKVFSCGNNEFGQLGLNDQTTIPQQIMALNKYKIISLSAGLGGAHSLFLDSDGHVFGCGDNSCGQLGIGSIGLDPVKPQRLTVPEDDKIVAISGGCQFSLFLTDKGKVFFSGKYDLRKQESQATPKPIIGLYNHKVIAISAGGHHSLFLTDKGKVFAGGKNSSAQLGSGDYSDRCDPQYPLQITKFFNEGKIVSIIAGRSCSFFTNDNDDIFGCGFEVFPYHNPTSPEKIVISISSESNANVVIKQNTFSKQG